MKVSQALYVVHDTERNNMDGSKETLCFADLLKTCAYQVKIQTSQCDFANISAQAIVYIDFKDTKLNAKTLYTYREKCEHRKIVIVGLDQSMASNESSMLKHGITGVFYSHDPIDLIVKGIQQVKAGKLWFKRATMEHMVQELLPLVTQNNHAEKHKSLTHNILSKRELLVVSLIQDGAKNQEIADKLHISLNTVKTHIYSIFKKTSCRNRVELIKWSMQSELVS
ncbi:helix-turn-helix transcriptional regulator [Glaciecola petra]|uniref:Response regulator transcription factor n=1 Tax=Glaciecola petra TaxID=3075602 RepID=A0ABU2ZP90_9ALTE|nr:response regulator transcription factor [Aestuariibacter sp. P117]MDT0594086.1 response regulator transcription factor [Aestuariibacter sp. P117]